MESISANIIRDLELAAIGSRLAGLVANSRTHAPLQQQSEYIDPICEALNRMALQKTGLLLTREVIPGNRNTIESIEVDIALYDTRAMASLLAFKESNTLFSKALDIDQINSMKKLEDNVVIPPLIAKFM